MKRLLQRALHAPWLLTAAATLSVGLVCVLPHLLIPALLGGHGSYSGLNVTRNVNSITYDETALYAAQLNYVARTLHPPLDVGNWEHRSDPNVVPTLPYYMVAPIVWLAGSTDTALQIADFLLPMLGFLAAFAVARQMGASKPTSIAAALMLMIPAQAPRNCLVSVLALLRLRPAPVIPLEYTRYLAPEVSLTLLLFATWLLLRARTIRDGVIAGIAGGLLFYTYLFTWVVWLPAAGLLVLYRTAMARSWRAIDKPSLSAVITACLVGIPFAVEVVTFSRSAATRGMTSRMQYTVGHVPDMATLTWTVVIGTLLILAWRLAKAAPSEREALVVVAGGLVAYDGQVILGKTLENFHLPNRFFLPYLALVLTVCVLGRLQTRLQTASAIALAAGCLAVGVSRQLQLSIYGSALYEMASAKRELFAVLSRVALDDEVVVASNGDLNYLIPPLTRQRAFLSYYALTTATNEEQAERFAITRKLLGYDLASTTALLVDGDAQSEESWTVHLMKANTISRAKAEELLRPWEGIAFPEAVHRYRVDWIVVSPADPPSAGENAVAAGGTLEATGAYGRLYRVPREGPRASVP